MESRVDSIQSGRTTGIQTSDSTVFAHVSPCREFPLGKVRLHASDSNLYSPRSRKVINLRDVGSVVNACLSGLRFKPNALIRSGNLHSVNSMADVSMPSIVVNLTQVEDRLPEDAQPCTLIHLPPPQKSDLYNLTVASHRAWIKSIVHAIANETTTGSVLIHCNFGKDRTGLAVAALLKSLDVDDQVIMQDYELSKGALALPSFRQSLAQMNTVLASLSQEQRQRLRERFLLQTSPGFGSGELLENCCYEFGKFNWITDHQGRVREVSGEVCPDTVAALALDPEESKVSEAFTQELKRGALQHKALLISPKLGGPIKEFNMITLPPQARKMYSKANRDLRLFFQKLEPRSSNSVSKILKYDGNSKQPSAIYFEYGAAGQHRPVRVSIHCD